MTTTAIILMTTAAIGMIGTVILLWSIGRDKPTYHGECPRCGAIFGSPGLQHCPLCETWLGKSKPLDANNPAYREWLIQEYLYRHQLDARSLNDVERAEKWADEMVGKLPKE